MAPCRAVVVALTAGLVLAIPREPKQPLVEEAEPVCSSKGDTAACTSLAQMGALTRQISSVSEDDQLPHETGSLANTASELLRDAEAGIANVATEAEKTISKLPAEVASEVKSLTTDADAQAKRLAHSLEAAAVGATAAVPGASAIATALQVAAPETAKAIEHSAKREVRLLQEAATEAVTAIKSDLDVDNHGLRNEVPLVEPRPVAPDHVFSKVELENLQVREAEQRALDAEMEQERRMSQVGNGGAASLLQTAMSSQWHRGVMGLTTFQSVASICVFFFGLILTACVSRRLRKEQREVPIIQKLPNDAFLERIPWYGAKPEQGYVQVLQ